MQHIGYELMILQPYDQEHHSDWLLGLEADDLLLFFASEAKMESSHLEERLVRRLTSQTEEPLKTILGRRVSCHVISQGYSIRGS
jgi:hypothetical protein